MRNLTHHIVEGDAANHQLTVTVEDEPGSGGANHQYLITGFNSATNPSNPWTDDEGKPVPSQHLTVLFQNGPINEAGVNGVTHETLLAILIDRMEGFQAGPFANENNKAALINLRAALTKLQDRTRARIARGVEGTHQQ